MADISFRPHNPNLFKSQKIVKIGDLDINLTFEQTRDPAMKAAERRVKAYDKAGTGKDWKGNDRDWGRREVLQPNDFDIPQDEVLSSKEKTKVALAQGYEYSKELYRDFDKLLYDNPFISDPEKQEILKATADERRIMELNYANSSVDANKATILRGYLDRLEAKHESLVEYNELYKEAEEHSKQVYKPGPDGKIAEFEQLKLDLAAPLPGPVVAGGRINTRTVQKERLQEYQRNLYQKEIEQIGGRIFKENEFGQIPPLTAFRAKLDSEANPAEKSKLLEGYRRALLVQEKLQNEKKKVDEEVRIIKEALDNPQPLNLAQLEGGNVVTQKYRDPSVAQRLGLSRDEYEMEEKANESLKESLNGKSREEIKQVARDLRINERHKAVTNQLELSNNVLNGIVGNDRGDEPLSYEDQVDYFRKNAPQPSAAARPLNNALSKAGDKIAQKLRPDPTELRKELQKNQRDLAQENRVTAAALSNPYEQYLKDIKAREEETGIQILSPASRKLLESKSVELDKAHAARRKKLDTDLQDSTHKSDDATDEFAKKAQSMAAKRVIMMLIMANPFCGGLFLGATFLGPISDVLGGVTSLKDLITTPLRYMFGEPAQKAFAEFFAHVDYTFTGDPYDPNSIMDSFEASNAKVEAAFDNLANSDFGQVVGGVFNMPFEIVDSFVGPDGVLSPALGQGQDVMTGELTQLGAAFLAAYYLLGEEAEHSGEKAKLLEQYKKDAEGIFKKFEQEHLKERMANVKDFAEKNAVRIFEKDALGKVLVAEINELARENPYKAKDPVTNETKETKIAAALNAAIPGLDGKMTAAKVQEYCEKILYERDPAKLADPVYITNLAQVKAILHANGITDLNGERLDALDDNNQRLASILTDVCKLRTPLDPDKVRDFLNDNIADPKVEALLLYSKFFRQQVPPVPQEDILDELEALADAMTAGRPTAAQTSLMQTANDRINLVKEPLIREAYLEYYKGVKPGDLLGKHNVSRIDVTAVDVRSDFADKIDDMDSAEYKKLRDYIVANRDKLKIDPALIIPPFDPANRDDFVDFVLDNYSNEIALSYGLDKKDIDSGKADVDPENLLKAFKFSAGQIVDPLATTQQIRQENNAKVISDLNEKLVNNINTVLKTNDEFKAHAAPPPPLVGAPPALPPRPIPAASAPAFVPPASAPPFVPPTAQLQLGINPTIPRASGPTVSGFQRQSAPNDPNTGLPHSAPGGGAHNPPHVAASQQNATTANPTVSASQQSATPPPASGTGTPPSSPTHTPNATPTDPRSLGRGVA